MKKSISFLTFIFLLLTISPIFAAQTYKIDPGHSYVLWQVSHFGFSNPSGKWMVSGTIDADEAKPQNSKINVFIEVANVITGVPDLDKHLKNADFFDVAKYPKATFVSKEIEMLNDNQAKIKGILTVHGVSKPVTLEVKLNKRGISPITKKETAGFSGITTIKRSDFGIDKFLPGLGDEVKIIIELEAIKAK